MKADRLAKLAQMGSLAPLLPVVDPEPHRKPDRVPAVRLSTSLPQSEVDRLEEMGREHALATGEKPTQSELMRAGLELLAGMTVADRNAVIAKLLPMRRGR